MPVTAFFFLLKIRDFLRQNILHPPPPTIKKKTICVCVCVCKNGIFCSKLIAYNEKVWFYGTAATYISHLQQVKQGITTQVCKL